MISEMSKEKSCLILDADHDSLTTNFKKIYLGYWCLENYNNSFKELDNFNVINSKSRDEKEIENEIKEIKKIYNSLITELSYFLNQVVLLIQTLYRRAFDVSNHQYQYTYLIFQIQVNQEQRLYIQIL